jgi:hypothetical protein
MRRPPATQAVIDPQPPLQALDLHSRTAEEAQQGEVGVGEAGVEEKQRQGAGPNDGDPLIDNRQRIGSRVLPDPTYAELIGIEAGRQFALTAAGGNDGYDATAGNEGDLLIGDGIAAPHAGRILEAHANFAPASTRSGASSVRRNTGPAPGIGDRTSGGAAEATTGSKIPGNRASTSTSTGGRPLASRPRQGRDPEASVTTSTRAVTPAMSSVAASVQRKATCAAGRWRAARHSRQRSGCCCGHPVHEVRLGSGFKALRERKSQHGALPPSGTRSSCRLSPSLLRTTEPRTPARLLGSSRPRPGGQRAGRDARPVAPTGRQIVLRRLFC